METQNMNSFRRSILCVCCSAKVETELNWCQDDIRDPTISCHKPVYVYHHLEAVISRRGSEGLCN